MRYKLIYALLGGAILFSPASCGKEVEGKLGRRIEAAEKDLDARVGQGEGAAAESRAENSGSGGLKVSEKIKLSAADHLDACISSHGIVYAIGDRGAKAGDRALFRYGPDGKRDRIDIWADLKKGQYPIRDFFSSTFEKGSFVYIPPGSNNVYVSHRFGTSTETGGRVVMLNADGSNINGSPYKVVFQNLHKDIYTNMYVLHLLGVKDNNLYFQEVYADPDGTSTVETYLMGLDEKGEPKGDAVKIDTGKIPKGLPEVNSTPKPVRTAVKQTFDVPTIFDCVNANGDYLAVVSTRDGLYSVTLAKLAPATMERK